MHLQTVAFCKNWALEKCLFTGDKCWWRHRNPSELSEHEVKHTAEIVKCYICQTQFENKSSMMVHRKKEVCRKELSTDSGK